MKGSAGNGCILYPCLVGDCRETDGLYLLGLLRPETKYIPTLLASILKQKRLPQWHNRDVWKIARTGRWLSVSMQAGGGMARQTIPPADSSLAPCMAPADPMTTDTLNTTVSTQVSVVVTKGVPRGTYAQTPNGKLIQGNHSKMIEVQLFPTYHLRILGTYRWYILLNIPAI